MSNETEKNLNTEADLISASEPERGLSPEKIEHLLKVLGDDVINDMLESAGFIEDAKDLSSDDDAEAVIIDSAASSESTDDPKGNDDIESVSDASEVKMPVKKKRSRRKNAAKRRFLFVILFVLILLSAYAINKIYMSVSINSNDPIQYSTQTDEISADNGTLNVNNVSVTVPSDGSEKYSISYSWSEEDDQYPSVPHAITAIYPDAESAGDAAGPDSQDEEEKMLYSISLYRNETIPEEDAKNSGKKADSWFDDWAAISEGDVLQTPLKSGDINGFYIFPNETDESGEAPDYNDYSYYFAVSGDDGINIYVIEGVCIDAERSAEFRTIMEDCIQSITIDD